MPLHFDLKKCLETWKLTTHDLQGEVKLLFVQWFWQAIFLVFYSHQLSSSFKTDI